jgi:hypothetical protein
MAYIYDTDEEFQEQQQQQPTIGAGGVGPSPQSGVFAGVASEKPKDGSGKFVNFDRYIDANRDVASQQGQKLAGAIGSEVSGIRSGLGQRVAQTNSDIAKSGVQSDGSALPQPNAYNYSEDGRTGSVTQGLTSGPAVDAAEAERRSNTTYSGPQGVDDSKYYGDWTKYADNVEKTRQKASAAQTAEGLGELGGGRNVGAKNFNGSLMNATSQNAFRDVGNKFQAFDAELGKAKTGTHDAAVSRGNESETLRDAWTASLGNFKDIEARNLERGEAARLARETGAASAEREEMRATYAQKLTEARRHRQVRARNMAIIGLPGFSGENPEEAYWRQKLEELG